MLSATAKWGLILILMLLLAGCAEWSEFSRRVENPYPGDVAAVARGDALYVSQGCPACHGQKGGGDGTMAARLPVLPPDFTNRERMITRSDPDLFWAIVRGRERGQMPPYGKELSGNDIWDVVNYLRSLYR